MVDWSTRAPVRPGCRAAVSMATNPPSEWPYSTGRVMAEGVAEPGDVVGRAGEAPARRVAPGRAAMAGQVQVDDLGDLGQPGEVGLEVGVVEAPGPPCNSTTVGRWRI